MVYSSLFDPARETSLVDVAFAGHQQPCLSTGAEKLWWLELALQVNAAKASLRVTHTPPHLLLENASIFAFNTHTSSTGCNVSS